MRPVYSIQHYTNDGELKPPVLFHATLAFLARTWILWAMSVAGRQDGSEMLTLFYPHRESFLLGLGTGLLAVFLFILSGRSHKAENRYSRRLWQHGRWLLLLGYSLDLCFQLRALQLSHWVFSWGHAIPLVLTAWFMLYIWNSKHLRHAFELRGI